MSLFTLVDGYMVPPSFVINSSSLEQLLNAVVAIAAMATYFILFLALNYTVRSYDFSLPSLSVTVILNVCEPSNDASMIAIVNVIYIRSG